MSEKRDGLSRIESAANITSMLLIPAVLFVAGNRFTVQQKELEQARATEEARANRLTSLVEKLSSTNDKERILATKMATYLAEIGQLPAEILPALFEIAGTDSNPKVSKGASQSLQAAAANVPLPAPVRKAIGELPPRVYIQIAQEQQRGVAQTIQRALADEGWLAPGVENVSGKADIPGRTNVRFFDEADRAAADRAVAILRSHRIDAYAYHVKHVRAPTGTLEVWFAANARPPGPGQESSTSRL